MGHCHIKYNYDCDVTIPGLKYPTSSGSIVAKCTCFYCDATSYKNTAPLRSSSPSAIVTNEHTVLDADNTVSFYIHCSTISCCIVFKVTLAN